MISKGLVCRSGKCGETSCRVCIRMRVDVTDTRRNYSVRTPSFVTADIGVFYCRACQSSQQARFDSIRAWNFLPDIVWAPLRVWGNLLFVPFRPSHRVASMAERLFQGPIEWGGEVQTGCFTVWWWEGSSENGQCSPCGP